VYGGPEGDGESTVNITGLQEKWRKNFKECGGPEEVEKIQ
jgi:hypothetical protein